MKTASFEDTGERWEGDLKTYPICADLSRADWLLLYKLCCGKEVVEAGSGGSTLMIASVAASLVSYESNQAWFDLVVNRLSKQGRRCVTALYLIGETHPAKLTPPPTPADVYFIDCYAAGRNRWLSWALQNRAARQIVLHDSRRESTLVSLEALYRCPDAFYIKTVEYHCDGSNMLVITPRQTPMRYENWNQAEPEYRRKHLHHA